MYFIATSLSQLDMMGRSVLMVILILGIWVFGGLRHSNAERSAGRAHPPQKQSMNSPLYSPVHAPKSHSPYHPPHSSHSQHLNIVPASAPSPSPYISIPHAASVPTRRTAISPSPSPSLVLPRTKAVAPVASMATTMQQASPPMSASHEMHYLRVLIIVAITFAPFLLGAILMFTYCTWVYKRNSSPVHLPSPAQTLQKQSDNDDSDANKGMSLGPLINRLSSFRISKRRGCAFSMEYPDLQAATNNFSSYNVLGMGSFGCVYRAQFHDGLCAAVKKLDEDREQAEDEFQSEVELMGKIRHVNLVSLLGFCARGKTRLLVYELMQNGSLEEQLHGPSRGSALTWHLRLKIALDVARGLEHMHEHCDPAIIHCDLKSSNILLDARFNAKLSDFGLAVTAQRGMDRKDIEVLGTLGYVAPEYLLDGKLTEKSDVYAFGVVLLELITGRKPVDKSMPAGCQSLVTWAKPQLTDRSKLPAIVDPMIKQSLNLKHLYQVAAVAVLCVQPEPGYRPLIADVVHSLIPLVPVELGGALRNADIPRVIEMKPLVATGLSPTRSNPEL